MSKKRSMLPKAAQTVIHVIAAVLLNLGIVFSAVYILFHILDQYNPHQFIDSNLPWLPIAIPVLLILSVLLYDLLFVDRAFHNRPFNKNRLLLIILCDLILFCALTMTLYLRTCTNSFVESNTIEEFQLPTPVITPSPSFAQETPAPGSPDVPEESLAPGETPAVEPDDTSSPDPASQASVSPDASPAAGTDVPMESKFPEKFSDPPTEHSYDKSNVVETLADGTEKALIYTYSGRNAAVDIYHYQKGKLEYQLADIYVRNLDCFKTEYSASFKNNVKTQKYASRVNAIVATNGDNFNSGKISDGIVIRNGAQLYPEGGAKQTRFSRDLCVLYHDGTMGVYDCVLDRISYDEILAKYPVQAFYFGPKLLNDDGTSKQKFNSTLSKTNPRTALGYYEPGHYALIVVLGTREMVGYNGRSLGNGKSPGMTLAELSELCEQLGFAAAYNLDGGGSSSMVWDKTVFGHNDRTHSDILAVVDP